MTPRKNWIPFTAQRLGWPLFLGVVASAVMLLATACGGSTSETPQGVSDTPDVVSDGIVPDGSAGQETVITVYSSPT
jgi:ABC-type phosphate/phosphonate transport system substrate-binding protein